MSGAVIWIGYTTMYRDGGPRLAQVARSMVRDFRAQYPHAQVYSAAVEDKRAFVDQMKQIADRGQHIEQLHFVGHSGMYGPMFGTTSLPEQFSPHEWETMEIPFGENGEAFFHACRTARWFAPFFARTFGVPAHGFHWYTAFSACSDRFVFAPPWYSPREPLYLLGCPGKKSHGWVGSLGKHTGLIKHEQIKRFEPDAKTIDDTYDPVAELYDAVFEDIKVREDEWTWLVKHLPRTNDKLDLLDIGAGNGAMLRELSPRLNRGVGVDNAARMVEVATERSVDHPMLSFHHINGPQLPFEDNSFDVVTSFLSFRYLDWDPIMREIVRVLKPGGSFLVIDMVTAPVKWKELPLLVQSKVKQKQQLKRYGRFHEALSRLVKDERWAQMLEFNPIRAEHELRWYMESRFPGQSVEMLNVGWHNRVLAFDTGPIFDDYVAPQSYP